MCTDLPQIRLPIQIYESIQHGLTQNNDHISLTKPMLHEQTINIVSLLCFFSRLHSFRWSEFSLPKDRHKLLYQHHVCQTFHQVEGNALDQMAIEFQVDLG